MNDMSAIPKEKINGLEKMAKVKIQQTDVTHIIRTHTEGQNNSQIITLEQSKDYKKWFIQTVNGDLKQLSHYEKLIGNDGLYLGGNRRENKLDFLLNRKTVKMNFCDITLFWGVCSIINLVVFLIIGV